MTTTSRSRHEPAFSTTDDALNDHPRSELLNHYTKCPMCTASSWAQARQKLTCKKCGEQFSVDSDVIIFRSKPVDKASKFHDISGGPKFTGVQFADNPQVYSANRIYAKYLDQWFQLRRGTVLDLGCGGGGLSLWALNAGFPLVVAVDSNIVSLQRLVRQAAAIK